MSNASREDREYYDIQWKKSSSIIAAISVIGISLCLITLGVIELIKFIIR